MENKYTGMTVNERLYLSGLIDEFDKAVSERNVDEAVRILKKVELTEDNIKPILEKCGLYE
jgi:molecular chaperone GrpE (heat shock protein)